MMRRVLLLTIFFNLALPRLQGLQADGQDQEGIRLFKAKQYEQSLTAFQNADNQQLNSLLGQLFCNVALGNFDQIDPVIALIDQKLQPLPEGTNCDTPPDDGPLTKEKQMLSYNCRRHVREVSNEMRQTVEKIVRETVPGTFQKIKVLRQLYPFIDALEQVGIGCCQSYYPLNCCLDPLLEQLNAWKDFGLGD